MAKAILACISLALIVLFSAGALAAGDAQYWTVVQDNAPASEVIAAANFAASMKSAADVSFTGKTRSQVSDALRAQDLDDTLIVFFDGKSAKIMQGTLPELDLAAREAQAYLRDQGYTVTMSSDTRILEGDSMGNGDTRTPSSSPPAVENVTAAPQQQGGNEVLQTPDMPQPAAENTDTAPPMPPAQAPEQEGAFSRFWQWFAGLFS